MNGIYQMEIAFLNNLKDFYSTDDMFADYKIVIDIMKLWNSYI